MLGRSLITSAKDGERLGMPPKMQRGHATLEFVLVLPLMGLFVLLIAFAGYRSYQKLAAQNSAYSGMVFNARSRIGFVGNSYAQQATLFADLGMRQMLESSVVEVFALGQHGWSRRGGSGMTVYLSGPQWSDSWPIFEGGGAEDNPSGTAFFMYSPFISAGPAGWLTRDGN
jgi:hypothetical protein